MYSTTEGNILLFKERISLFLGKFAEQERMLSTREERCSTTGKASREGISEVF